MDHLLSRVQTDKSHNYQSKAQSSLFRFQRLTQLRADDRLQKTDGLCSVSCNQFSVNGELAQLGERLFCTQEVSGSIPLFSTI